MPLGVLVLDEKGVVFCNREAERFSKRFRLPEEIGTVSGRLFKAARESKLSELFPGEIIFPRKIDSSPSNWVFRMKAIENPKPLVIVFISEEQVSDKMDLNKLRIDYRLTRRELDVVRRVVNGRKNRDIAEEFGISEQTVKDHLSNIHSKLGINSRLGIMQLLVNSPYAGRIDEQDAN
jgi:DNA-binding CsgD family transcriptional regulator